MRKFTGSKASRAVAFLLAAVILLCTAPSSAAAAAPKFSYKDAQDAKLKALDCLMTCGFSVEYNSDDSTLKRWEKTIWIYVSGSPSSEDKKQLDKFIIDIATHCPNMPNIRLASSEEKANIVIWYGPLKNMSKHVDGYHEGNWGYFSYQTSSNKITGAKIAIASDKNSKESKKHLLLEELVGAFGLTNDHNDYSDSILYAPWTTVGSLSKVDWLMLNMLYDPDLKCGMGANEAYSILRDKIMK